MLEPIGELASLSRAVCQRDAIVAGRHDFREEWLALGHVAGPEESALHFDEEQCTRFSRAFRQAGVDKLVAVATEELKGGPFAYELGSSAQDLGAFSYECSGVNVVLMGEKSEDFAILCTTDDFLLVGGSRSFVSDAFGDPAEAELRFNEFVSSHFEVARPLLKHASKYFATFDRSS
jgi:hypothetical protein